MFKNNVIENFTASKWWRIMGTKTAKQLNPQNEFCTFIVNLMNCPASSASLERMFSTFGMVWSTLRNRLGVEKAEKLVKIYRYVHSNFKQ